MWNNGEGYYSKFKYVEFARYLEIEETKMVARYMLDKKLLIPRLIDIKDVDWWREKNANSGIYISIFRYADKDFKPQQVSIGNLYFDIDSPEPETALEDARKIVEHLIQFIPERAIRIYFTGKKGYHIECEAVTLGITPNKNLAEVYRFIANDLVSKLDIRSIDFAVYDPRRIWRLPNSIHQGTGLYKVALSLEELLQSNVEHIKTLASTPRDMPVPDQTFDIRSNEWYREYTYKLEESKLNKNVTQQSIIERFQSHGSSHIEEHEMIFNPKRLFENCPAILSLWSKAEKEHNLDHEERLFLCSILTYTDEAVEYLHAILSNCTDYNFEKSQSHISDWIRRRDMGIGGNPYSCERAASAGISCVGCEKLEPKPKYEKIGGKLYPTNDTASPSPIRFSYDRKMNS